jgi:ChrR-like protein with cupin domain
VEHRPPDVNTDLSLPVAVDATARDWEASPSRTVWRKTFYRSGGEKGPVTSMVRYDAQSSFASHAHPDGEEILVLEGVFSDEHGDYPAGTFLLNPPAFAHSPRSLGGCTLFVHLRQYGGTGRRHVVVDTHAMRWTPTDRAGIEQRELHVERALGESIALERWTPRTAAIVGAGAASVEVFVLDGAIESELGLHERYAWLRAPAGAAGLHFGSAGGCTLYVRTT